MTRHTRICKPWSEADMQFLRTNYSAKTTRWMADAMNRSMSSIQKQANMHGVHKLPEAIAEAKRLGALNCSEKSKATRFKPVHGYSVDKRAGSIYNCWLAIIARCHDEKHKSYRVYGGAGISMCPEWRNSFSRFLADMGERPAGTSIDRINGGGNYEPGNCRWASPKDQARNRKNILRLSAFGSERLLVEWCEQFGIESDTLLWRIRKLNMTPEAALSTPVRAKDSARQRDRAMRSIQLQQAVA